MLGRFAAERAHDFRIALAQHGQLIPFAVLAIADRRFVGPILLKKWPFWSIMISRAPAKIGSESLLSHRE
jgi:hypothetical protein